MNVEKRRQYAREYARRWRAKPENRERFRATQRRYYKRMATWKREHRHVVREFTDWLKNVPCYDCGNSFPPYAMDFDHRDPMMKINDVSRLRTASLNRLLDEITKCDIICAICHRIRTHNAT